MADQESTLEPGDVIAEYRIEKVLGSGSFGVTYLARDMHLSRGVAIKEYMPVVYARRDFDRDGDLAQSRDGGHVRMGARALLRGGAHPRPVQPSQHRPSASPGAGRQRHRLYRDGAARGHEPRDPGRGRRTASARPLPFGLPPTPRRLRKHPPDRNPPPRHQARQRRHPRRDFGAHRLRSGARSRRAAKSGVQRPGDRRLLAARTIFARNPPDRGDGHLCARRDRLFPAERTDPAAVGRALLRRDDDPGRRGRKRRAPAGRAQGDRLGPRAAHGRPAGQHRQMAGGDAVAGRSASRAHPKRSGGRRPAQPQSPRPPHRRRRAAGRRRRRLRALHPGYQPTARPARSRLRGPANRWSPASPSPALSSPAPTPWSARTGSARTATTTFSRSASGPTATPADLRISGALHACPCRPSGGGRWRLCGRRSGSSSVLVRLDRDWKSLWIQKYGDGSISPLMPRAGGVVAGVEGVGSSGMAQLVFLSEKGVVEHSVAMADMQGDSVQGVVPLPGATSRCSECG